MFEKFTSETISTPESKETIVDRAIERFSNAIDDAALYAYDIAEKLDEKIAEAKQNVQEFAEDPLGKTKELLNLGKETIYENRGAIAGATLTATLMALSTAGGVGAKDLSGETPNATDALIGGLTMVGLIGGGYLGLRLWARRNATRDTEEPVRTGDLRNVDLNEAEQIAAMTGEQTEAQQKTNKAFETRIRIKQASRNSAGALSSRLKSTGGDD